MPFGGGSPRCASHGGLYLKRVRSGREGGVAGRADTCRFRSEVPCFVHPFQPVTVVRVLGRVVIQGGKFHFDEILVVFQVQVAGVGQPFRKQLAVAERAFVVDGMVHDAQADECRPQVFVPVVRGLGGNVGDTVQSAHIYMPVRHGGDGLFHHFPVLHAVFSV